MRKYAFALVAIAFTCVNSYAQAIVTPRRHTSVNQENKAQQPARPEQKPALPAALPVSAIKINAKIDGQIATVRVEHQFRNNTDEALEGTYYFPVHEGATLIEFAVYDGDERRVGRVKEKEEARALYSSATAQGEDPAILEMTKRGWFQSHIYPIPPHSDKKIEITYSELLSEKDGVFTFDYPLGAGYKKLKIPVDRVEIEVELRSEAAIKNVFSPTHPLDINYASDNHATSKTITAGGADAENFKLTYQLSNEEISASLVTYRERGKDGYFLLMLSPKIDFDKKRISAKDVVFVIDVSLSMEGDKIRQAKEALRYGLKHTLNEGDRFNVIAFAGEVNPFERKLIQATPASIARALDFVDRLTLESATNINDALLAAVAMIEAGNRAQNIVFITDGQPTASITDPATIAANVKSSNTARARLFTFGVGADVNHLLLEKLAAENHGGALDIKDQSQLSRTLSTFFSMVSKPVLSDLKVDFGPVSVDRVQPAQLPDLYTRTQIRIFGRYRNQEDLENAVVSLAGRMNEQFERFDFTGLHFPLVTSDKDFLPKLWATERVSALLAEMRVSGERADLKQEVIDLAREFNLVTPYTSMYVPTTAELEREKEGAKVAEVNSTIQDHQLSKKYERLQLMTELQRSPDKSAAPASGIGKGKGSGGGVSRGKGHKKGPGLEGPGIGGGDNPSPAPKSDGSPAIIPRQVQVAPPSLPVQQTAQASPGAVVDSNGAAIAGATATVETATVTTTQPVIDNSTSYLTTSQEANKITDLPSLAPIYSFARLTPGINETVAPGIDTGKRAGSGLQINGQSPRMNMFMIDGQDNNGIDGLPAVSIKTFDSVETLQVLATRGTGDLSHTGGASTNLITRNGTNEFHGSLFDYHRSRKFGALSPLERRSGLDEKPKLRSDIFGGTLGGPIKRDRAFFFGSFAGETENSQGFVDSTISRLTPTARGLEVLRQAFPNSPTINDLILRGPVARVIGNPRVTRTLIIPTLGVPVEFGQITRLVPSRVSGYEGGGRIDFQMSNRNRLQASYWYDGRSVDNSYGNLAAGFPANQSARAGLAGVKLASVLSPRSTNELGFTFNRTRLSLEANSSPGLSVLPGVSIGLRGLGYGESALAGNSQSSNLFHVSESLIRVDGRHNLRLGFQFGARSTHFDFLPGARGLFTYATFDDFVADAPTSLVVASGEGSARFRQWNTHFYIDDAWRARSNLTLSVGLSYENTNQPINRLVDRLRKRESNPSTALFDSSIPLAAKTMEKIARDNNNLAPRIGFAYMPRIRPFGINLFGEDKSVIRGGASISYDSLSYRPLADVAASSPNVLLAVLTPDGATAVPGFPHVPGAIELRALVGGDPAAYGRTLIDSKYRTPYSIEWHLEASREFDEKLTVSAGYAGTRGSGLIRSLDGNPSSSGGPVRIYETSGHSIYHSLQARADMKFKNQLTGGISYTFSKLIDDVPSNNAHLIGGPASASSLLAPSLHSFAQDPFDVDRGARALSSLDRRHSFTAHFVWDLPSSHSQDGFIGRLLSGWKASGIVELSSGMPFTPLQYFAAPGSSKLFASIFSDRLGSTRPFAGNPNAPVDAVAFSNAANSLLKLFLNSDGSVFLSPTGFIVANRSGFRAGQTADARFIYNDFVVEQAARSLGLSPDAFGETFARGRAFGDVGRNTLVSPRFANIDFALLKSTKLTEKVYLQFRAEFFNLLNHPNRATPDFKLEHAGGFGFADLGESDAAPRRVRIALKLIF